MKAFRFFGISRFAGLASLAVSLLSGVVGVGATASVTMFFVAAAVAADAKASGISEADERVKVWITLADKGSLAASDGRVYEDAPVHAPYLAALRAAGVEIAVTLKWQNRVSGWVDAARLDALANLPFVRAVEELPRKAGAAGFVPETFEIPAAPLPKSSAATASAKTAAEDFGALQTLFTGVGGAALRDTVSARGLKPGAGMRVAVMDADFRLGHQAFDSLYARGAIVDQYDFVANNPVAVTRALGNSHGAQVLSQIGGELPGVLQGLAPHARFLLYRTEEEINERYVEEDYLAAALERAVDSGAHVISISLSYRYDMADGQVPYRAMNGRTRPASIAAVGAARRGAVVVVAVGNEGLSRADSGGGAATATITSPGDADSILAVGAVSTAGARCSYSSTGPTFDGRRKPEVSSIGCSMPQANTSTATGVFSQSGTSFAAPVVAGLAVLLRQLRPESTGTGAQQIRAALMNTARRTGAPDNLTGNGIANGAEAWCLLALQGPCVPTPVALHAPRTPASASTRASVSQGFDWSRQGSPTASQARDTRDLRGRRVAVMPGVPASPDAGRRPATPVVPAAATDPAP